MDDFANLPRHGDEALGPCALCQRVMLDTGMPIFYRLTVRQCGVDRKAVNERVGLAMMLGGGQQGIILSGVMGPGTKPVVEVSSHDTNICMPCMQKYPELMLLIVAQDGDDK